MTTATDNRAGDFRCRADARVRPDDGILDARSLFDETSRPQHGIDYLRARFDLAVVADDRNVVELGGRR